MRNQVLFIMALLLCCALFANAEAPPTTRESSLLWTSTDGAVIAGESRFESSPVTVKSTLDLVLHDASVVTLSVGYEPWEDRHVWHLTDEASGWWATYSLDTESGYETVSEGLAVGMQASIAADLEITAELRTRDGVVLVDRQRPSTPPPPDGDPFVRHVVEVLAEGMPTSAVEAIDCLLRLEDQDVEGWAGLDSYLTVVDREVLETLVATRASSHKIELPCAAQRFELNSAGVR